MNYLLHRNVRGTRGDFPILIRLHQVTSPRDDDLVAPQVSPEWTAGEKSFPPIPLNSCMLC